MTTDTDHILAGFGPKDADVPRITDALIAAAKDAEVPTILPCPFCRHTGASIGSHAHADGDPGVWCEGCGAVGPTFREGQEREAIEAWNKLPQQLARYEPRLFPTHVPPQYFERWVEGNLSWELDEFESRKYDTSVIWPFLWRECVDPSPESLAELASFVEKKG